MTGETGSKPKEGVPEPVQGDEKELFGAVVESMKKMGEKMSPESLREALGPMFEFMQKAAGTVAAETKETRIAGATTKDIMAELPPHLREAVAGEQAGVDREVSKIGKDFAAAVIKFSQKEKVLFKKYPELAEALGKVLEIIAEIKNKEAREKKMPKVELRLDPEGAKFAETIRLALEVNKGERKNLLAEKNEIGNEFSEVYTQISNVIQGDKKLSKLYKKWGDLSMKGKNEDAEKVYAEAEKDTRMQGLGKHEKELNKQLREVNAKLLELDGKDAELMEKLKAILTGAKVEVTPPEPEKPKGPKGGATIPEEPEKEREEGWEGESMRPAEHEEEGEEPGVVDKDQWTDWVQAGLLAEEPPTITSLLRNAMADKRIKEDPASGKTIELDDDAVEEVSALGKKSLEAGEVEVGKLFKERKQTVLASISETVKKAIGKARELFAKKSKETGAKAPTEKEIHGFQKNFTDLCEELKSDDQGIRAEATDKLFKLKSSIKEPWQKEIFMQEARQRLIDSDIEVRYTMRALVSDAKDKISTPIFVSLLDHPNLAGHEQADIIQTLYNIDKDAFLSNFKKIAKLEEKDVTLAVFIMIEQIASSDAEVMEAARAADVIVEAEEVKGEEEGMKEAA